MKPSHLVAIMLAGLGIGGMSQAATTSPVPAVKFAIKSDAQLLETDLQYLMEGGARYGARSSSWHKRNQRQIRKDRRRAHAAGVKGAFR